MIASNDVKNGLEKMEWKEATTRRGNDVYNGKEDAIDLKCYFL